MTLKVIELMVPPISTTKTNPLQERHTREGGTLSPYAHERNSAAKLIPTYIAPGGLLPKLKFGMKIYLVVPAEMVCSERVYVVSSPIPVRGGTVIDADIFASKFATSSVAVAVKAEDFIIVTAGVPNLISGTVTVHVDPKPHVSAEQVHPLNISPVMSVHTC